MPGGPHACGTESRCNNQVILLSFINDPSTGAVSRARMPRIPFNSPTHRIAHQLGYALHPDPSPGKRKRCRCILETCLKNQPKLFVTRTTTSTTIMGENRMASRVMMPRMVIVALGIRLVPAQKISSSTNCCQVELPKCQCVAHKISDPTFCLCGALSQPSHALGLYHR